VSSPPRYSRCCGHSIYLSKIEVVVSLNDNAAPSARKDIGPQRTHRRRD
jgi:hypothetical protein